MYSVVQFDDGVCAIPSFWYKEKKCVWPTSKKISTNILKEKFPIMIWNLRR